MSTSSPVLISETDLSKAWGRALRHLLASPLKNPSPLLISLTGFQSNRPAEDQVIRASVDRHLAAESKFPVDTTAMTIFPYRTWKRRRHTGRKNFYDYAIKKLLPRLKARCPLNRRGMYFERMMAYEGVKAGSVEIVNQLEFVIGRLERGNAAGQRPRQSALQISCIDPAKDHIASSRQGFPCLQQVSVAYDDSKGMALSAYYPTQYLFDRGYGNYLGLCHLAEFIADAVSLSLVRVNFAIAHPQLGTGASGGAMSKRSLEGLSEVVEAACDSL